MATLISTLRQVIGPGRRAQRFFECRHCGTAVDSHGDACPTCGSDEIACYQLG